MFNALRGIERVEGPEQPTTIAYASPRVIYTEIERTYHCTIRPPRLSISVGIILFSMYLFFPTRAFSPSCRSRFSGFQDFSSSDRVHCRSHSSHRFTETAKPKPSCVMVSDNVRSRLSLLSQKNISRAFHVIYIEIPLLSFSTILLQKI